jgi:hypothetical protein
VIQELDAASASAEARVITYMEVGHARRGEKSATPIITGLANMSNQRLVILAVGVLLVWAAYSHSGSPSSWATSTNGASKSIAAVDSRAR